MTQPQAKQAEQQASATAQKVAALLAVYGANSIHESEFAAAVAAAIYRGKVLASRAADILVSTLANHPPLGLVPSAQHVQRLEEAVSTVLTQDAPDDALDGLAERLERLAEAETLLSTQKTLRAAIDGQGFTQYREDVASDACEKCQPYADQLHPASEPWEPHHPRCRCELVPVVSTQEEAA